MPLYRSSDAHAVHAQHFDDNLAILLRPGEGLAVEGVYEKTQTFYVLALVDEERKSNKRGMIIPLLYVSS